MEVCETPDFMFPMQASIYHPIVDQGVYGNIKKTWVLDRIVSCFFSTAGTSSKEEIVPNVNITQDKILIGRVKNDVRFSSFKTKNSVTNVLITDIKSSNGGNIYIETSGPRSGKSTIFEIATQDPFAGPFGDVEYYKLIIRRSENQAGDL